MFFFFYEGSYYHSEIMVNNDSILKQMLRSIDLSQLVTHLEGDVARRVNNEERIISVICEKYAQHYL